MEFTDFETKPVCNPETVDSFLDYAREPVIDSMEAVDFMGYLNHEPDGGDPGAVDFDSYATSSNGRAEPVVPPQPDYFETEFFRNPHKGSPVPGGNVDDLEATAYVAFHAPKPAPVKKIPARPIVGWLICVEGPDIGKDYRIYSQYNYIGRAEHMDICLSGDPCISAERAAIIAYDPRKNNFTFAVGTGHNLIYVNDEVLMNSATLNPYDQLTIGETKLLFIPLCGERFTWNTK